MIKPITIQEVEHIAFVLARELMTYNEPIPDFHTRFPRRLESCLLTPFQRFAGKALYRSLIAKATILFYLMIKNHPFQNGNKRIAVTTLLVFLAKNDKWLSVSPEALYSLSLLVASSDPKIKPLILKTIESYLRTYMVKRERTN